MYCNSCGKQIPDDAQLCAYCGRRVVYANGVAAYRRLVRVREGRKIAGVCKGFADYFDVDVALVRILWVACAVCGLLGLVGYIAAWIIMPEEPLALPAPVAQMNRATNI
jgi:phage shock protein C